MAKRAVGSGTRFRHETVTSHPPPHPEALNTRVLCAALVSLFAYVLLLSVIGIIFRNELTWTRRVAYFAVVVAACVPICVSHGVLTAHLSRLQARTWTVLSLAGSAILSAGSATVLVHCIDRLFRAGLPLYRLRGIYVLALIGMLLCVSVAQYAVLRLQKAHAAGWVAKDAGRGHAHRSSATSRPPGVAAPADAAANKFLDRLPAAVGRDVIYLRMRDHYVEVFTTAGHCSILMRFGDAVAELEGLGIQVHRSYWVGRGHVERLVRRGRSAVVQLTAGHDAPVSRSWLPAVEAALGTEARSG